MPDVLTALDATFLELEQQDEGALMSIGGVMVFEPLPGGGAPDLDAVCDGLASRLTQLPRYTQRLSSPRTGGLAWPRWVADPRFDIRNHVSRAALPAPGGAAELCDWTADFFSSRLDRRRPLWQMALLDGLEDGRWALVHKTHHCLVDGVGSVDVAHLLLDAEPTAPADRAVPAAQRAVGGGFDAAAPAFVQPLLQAAGAGSRALGGVRHAALHPRNAITRARGLSGVLVRDELIAAPPTSINVEIGSSRRYAVVTVPLAELKAIGRELGGSVNDVALAVCTAGLRKLLLAREERLPRHGLRAMVPVNIRRDSEELSLGNRISALFVDLPVNDPHPGSRLRRITAETRRLKASAAAAGAATMLDLTALAPPVLHSLLARSLYATRLFNLTITNVPGPQFPLYAFGARLRQVHPIVPLAAEHACGIAIFSYDGQLSFGVIADAETVPDLAVLAYGIEAGVEELLELSRKPLAV
jgi:diacylglycerol O-acyltransferase